MAKKFQTEIFSPKEKERYYYFTLGDKKDPAIMIIPGFSGLHDDLLPLGRDLKEKHFIIIPELPGWGKSSPLPGGMTIHNYAVFLKSLLDAIGVKKVTLIGHCMGSATVLEYCMQYPDMVSQAFVISVPYQDGMLSNTLFKQAADMSTHTPKRFRWVWYLWRSRVFGIPLAFLVIQSRSVNAKIKRILKTNVIQSKSNEEVVEENWNSLMKFPYEKTKSITVPLHIIHGAKDMLISPSQEEKFHDIVPHATFDLLPKAGHVPPVETPESLGSLIKQYL